MTRRSLRRICRIPSLDDASIPVLPTSITGLNREEKPDDFPPKSDVDPWRGPDPRRRIVSVGRIRCAAILRHDVFVQRDLQLLLHPLLLPHDRHPDDLRLPLRDLLPLATELCLLLQPVDPGLLGTVRARFEGG